jgi:hypothetical protein
MTNVMGVCGVLCVGFCVWLHDIMTPCYTPAFHSSRFSSVSIRIPVKRLALTQVSKFLLSPIFPISCFINISHFKR